MRIPVALLALVAGVFLSGCESKEEPARAAVASAEASLGEIREDAAKYAPDELKTTESDLGALKGELDRKRYKEVLVAAPKFGETVDLLKQTVVAKQTQVAAATNEWEALQDEVPKAIQSLETRVANLGTGKLPKEVSAESFAAAKTSLEQIKAQWQQASAAFTAGKALEAADQGRQVQAKAKEVSEQLAMSPV
jgi:hypothetical protein